MSLPQLPALPALTHDLAAATDRLRASTVAVLVGARTRHGPSYGSTGYGSGVVWRADGLIVTNAHVARSGQVTVALPDGRRVPARLVARDPRRDLAVLQAEADELTPALPGDPGALRAGHLVLALGHPLGFANALAVGIVHSTMLPSSTPIPHGRGPRARAPWSGAALIRADVRLLPGNSGGPLADAAGRVLGINTMVVGGLGVAVSIDEVRALLRDGGGTMPRDVPYAA